MIALALRALTRLIALVVLLAGALASAAVALSALSGSDGLVARAKTAGLPGFRDDVSRDLLQLEAGTASNTVTLVAAGVVLLSVLVIAGALVPRRQRLVALKADDTLAARRRVIGTALRTLARQASDVTGAKSRVRRRRARIAATHAVAADGKATRADLRARLTPVAEPFGLKLRVQSRRGARGRRVA